MNIGSLNLNLNSQNYLYQNASGSCIVMYYLFTEINGINESILQISMPLILKDFDVQMNYETGKIGFGRGTFNEESSPLKGGALIIIVVIVGVVILVAIIAAAIIISRKKRDNKLNYQLAKGSSFE